METREISKSLTDRLSEEKRRRLSRRSVLSFAGAIGAAAPFGMFEAARALTPPYIPGELLICRAAARRRRAAGAAASNQTRLECERGLHGGRPGRKRTRHLHQA